METTEAATPAALLELAAPEAGTTAKLGRSKRLGRSNGRLLPFHARLSLQPCSDLPFGRLLDIRAALIEILTRCQV